MACVLLATAASVAVQPGPARAATQTVVTIESDDGRADQAVNAGPILAAHNVQGTFFINTGLIGTDSYDKSGISKVCRCAESIHLRIRTPPARHRSWEHQASSFSSSTSSALRRSLGWSGVRSRGSRPIARTTSARGCSR